MLLQTDRLDLRPLSMDDLDALARLYADPEVMRYMSGGVTKTREETRERIASMMRSFEVDGIGQLAVVRREDGEVLGRCGLLFWTTDPWQPTARADATAPTETEIGYALGREHWGRGYATEAASAVRDHAQDVLGERRLIALIHEDNRASTRVAEKLGMTFEREIEFPIGPIRLHALER